jgi:hypothetical protein
MVVMMMREAGRFQIPVHLLKVEVVSEVLGGEFDSVVAVVSPS